MIVALFGCTGIQPTPVPPTPTAEAATPVVANEDIATDGEPALVIGAILFQNDTFFETVALGMEEAAQAAGAEIKFRFHEQDVAMETRWIEVFTVENVDAIIISPRVVDGSVAAIATAHAAGIKIICFNGCFTDEATAAYVSAVFETDQFALGYELGEYMGEWITDHDISTPEIGILGCCHRRHDGILQALTNHSVAWVESLMFEAYMADVATVMGESMLQERPEIDIIWAENEGGTIGAVNAVRALSLAGQVYVFGVDISPEIADMLLADDNILQAVGAQSPYLIGQRAVAGAIEAVRGNDLLGYNAVPGTFYSRDDRAAVEAFLRDE